MMIPVCPFMNFQIVVMWKYGPRWFCFLWRIPRKNFSMTIASSGYNGKQIKRTSNCIVYTTNNFYESHLTYDLYYILFPQNSLKISRIHMFGNSIKILTFGKNLFIHLFYLTNTIFIRPQKWVMGETNLSVTLKH